MKLTMTAILAALFVFIIVGNASAYTLSTQKKSKYGYNLMETGFAYEYSIPNVDGKKKTDNTVYIGGKHEWSWLHLDWEINFANALKIPKISDFFSSSYNYMYGKINPKLSVRNMMNKRNGLFYILKDVFITYRFDFDNNKGSGKGLMIHNMGVGIELDLPVFDYFKLNFYARYPEKNYEGVTFQYDGWLANAEFAITLHEFGSSGFKIVYKSWIDWVFESRIRQAYDTTDSIQWNNQFRIDYKFVYIAYTYQVNYHYMQQDRNSANSHMQGVGIYLYVKF